MRRFVPYLGIVAALAVGVLVMNLTRSTSVEPIRTFDTSVASSTGETVTNIATTSLAQATTTAKKVVPPAPNQAPNLDAPAATLMSALVNILCYVPAGSGFKSISASGVIIDPKGIIITNAHVGEYFLLADRKVSCTIRSGSPAVDKYTASLIYISPEWLRANADLLTETAPSGTGEFDFALLAVNTNATAPALSSSFPFIPLATTTPHPGAPVIIAAYGAQSLQTSQIQYDLLPTFVYGAVKKVFTFHKDTIDVLALGGSIAAQEGSSGGGVTDVSGKLVGVITTSTVEGAASTRSLDAITATYIRREFANETKGSLDTLLAEPTATATASFATQISTLEAIITTHLPN